MSERRTRPEPATAAGLLQELPAWVVLDRMPTPVIGLDSDGVLVYANPACAVMLGYPDAAAVLQQPMCALLAGHPLRSREDCLATLRGAGSTVVEWTHTEGFTVHAVVSHPLLLRASDPLQLFTLSDVTELLWGEGSH